MKNRYRIHIIYEDENKRQSADNITTASTFLQAVYKAFKIAKYCTSGEIVYASIRRA